MKQQNHHPNRPEQTHRNPQAAILSLLVGAAMLLLALVACTPNSDLDPAAAPAAPGAVTTLIGTKPAYTPLPATRTATTDDGAWQTGDQVTVSIRFYTTPDAPALATPAAETQQTLTYTAATATASRWTASPAIVAIPTEARSMRVDYTYQGTADPITATCERMKAYVTEATGSAISPDSPGDIFRPAADANDRLIPIGNVSGTLTLTPAFERLTALVSLDMQPAQHVLLTTALPQPGITPDHNSLYTLSAHIDATAQPATAHFHLMAPADDADAPADATFGLRIEGEAKTAYPAVPYRTGWKYHLDARSILSSGGGGNSGQDQQFVTTNAETDDLDPKIFNAKNPVWIITGGGKDDDAAWVVTDKVKAALQGLPAGSIELVLADVKMVGNNAFDGCTALNSVSLPAAKSIGSNAFSGCTALANIDLKAAESIGKQAFQNCTALATIDLTAAKSIEIEAFYDCTNLTTIDLPAATNIGQNAFDGCTALTTVTLPATVTAIENYAFLNCTALANIDLKAVKSIGQQAFQGCKALTNIDLTAAESIGQQAFYNCTALATVNLPATVTTIEDNAFGNCTALANIDLTAVKSIGSFAFRFCTVLATIDLPAVKSIGISAFQGCAALTTVTLPETVTAIETQVFEGCAALTTIDLPAVKSIGISAFQGCAALTTVVAPQVNNIGQNAFRGCKALASLQLTAPGNIKLHDYAFFDFDTAACTLTLNPDKKSDATGTATPKVVDGNKWWNDGRGTPAQWQQIDYTSTTPTTSTPAVDLPGITDGGKPY